MGERAFVTTQSIKKLKKFLKNWVLDPDGWRIAGSNQKVHLNDIRKLEDDRRTCYKGRWINENDLEQRLITTFSPVYQRYQSTIRAKQVERAIKKVENPSTLNKHNQNDPKRFIKTTHITNDGEIADKTQAALNQQQIDSESMYDGFYAVCTNLESTIEEVIKINQARWEIDGAGHIPVYTRTEITDALHDVLGFRTDFEIVTQKNMKKIFKLTKKVNSTLF